MSKRTSATVAAEIGRAPIEYITLYKQSVAVDAAIEKAEDEVRASIACVLCIWSTSIAEIGGDLITRSKYAASTSLAALHGMRTAILGHSDLEAATALLGPLYQEYDAAIERETAERLALSAAEDTLATVTAVALEKAKAAVATQLEVVKARTAYEAAATPIRERHPRPALEIELLAQD